MNGLPDEVAAWFPAALRTPVCGAAPGGSGALDRAATRALLPARAGFLYADEVLACDLAAGTVATRYDLAGSADVLAVHFPTRSVFPAPLQTEAIAQAGMLLCALRAGAPSAATIAAVIAARFVRAVLPGAALEVYARVLDVAPGRIVLGQCAQAGRICSAAAVVLAGAL